MFINCPHCRRLLALEPDGTPPTACRYCHVQLNGLESAPDRSGAEAVQSERMTSVDPAQLTASVPPPPPAAPGPQTTATTVPRSLATMLQPAQQPAGPTPLRVPVPPSSAQGGATNTDRAQSTQRAPGDAATAGPPATGPRPQRAPSGDTASLPAPATPSAAAQTTPRPAVTVARTLPVDTPPVAAPPPKARPAATTPQPASAPSPGAPPVSSAATPTRKPRRAAGTSARSAAPSFAKGTAGHHDQRKQRLMLGAAVILTVVLALQLVLAQRAQLSQSAGWRPLLGTLCGALGCSLPPWHEPAAFVVVERDIRSLQDPPGVLQVTARIRNEARWAQAWPRLQLTLSDVDGQPLATRVFQPAEYLGGTPSQSELASGADVAIRMQVIEPGPQAVAFTFDFH